MRTISLFLGTCIVALALISCGDESKESEYESIFLEKEISLSSYGADTIISVKEFVSEITEIKNNAEWLSIEILHSTNNSCTFKVICQKNTTTVIRATVINITCKNGDTLTLKVNQGVVDGFEDLHDIVTDQPTFAPYRWN